MASLDSFSGNRQRPRPAGRYVSTVWLPGNFLSDGLMVVNVALKTMDPFVLKFHETSLVRQIRWRGEADARVAYATSASSSVTIVA